MSGNIYVADSKIPNSKMVTWSKYRNNRCWRKWHELNIYNQLSYQTILRLTRQKTYILLTVWTIEFKKYKSTPKIIIPAGQTSAQLIVSGMVIQKTKTDETIVLEPGVTNATLASNETDSYCFDNNTPPTVTFTLVRTRLLKLTNRCNNSYIIKHFRQGYWHRVLMEGTATETVEYTVSSKRISIPAKARLAALPSQQRIGWHFGWNVRNDHF
jgi:hypothetical protein